MNLSLYKVEDEYLEECEKLSDQDDESQSGAFDGKSEYLTFDVTKWSISVAGYYKNLQKEAVAMREYEYEMRERRRVVENRADRLREYLKSNMQNLGIKKIKGPEFTISIRKSPDSVVIDDVYCLPDDYIKYSEIFPDKTKIKSAIQNGDEVVGAHLESGSSLIIR